MKEEERMGLDYGSCSGYYNTSKYTEFTSYECKGGLFKLVISSLRANFVICFIASSNFLDLDENESQPSRSINPEDLPAYSSLDILSYAFT